MEEDLNLRRIEDPIIAVEYISKTQNIYQYLLA